MTLLARAGIYLILDVNSPATGKSLNRHEPWTTYTQSYMKRVLRVVDQFLGYNNTLAFFAGNEIVNDDKSAMVAPNYIRAVVRDIKFYLANHSQRPIPVGYSAADDLRYRVSLPRYLRCGDFMSTIDFYGVNSYQWCGHQTFISSGYDILLRDYKNFSCPVILSEYGCNLVQPRLFEEIDSLYANPMNQVFSGGLVYEYSQEPNNFGLVRIDAHGNAHLLPDFETVRQKLSEIDHKAGCCNASSADPILDSSASLHTPPAQSSCLEVFPNLNTLNSIPDSVSIDMIAHGVLGPRGGFTTVPRSVFTKYRIYNTSGAEISDKRIFESPSLLRDPLPESNTAVRGTGSKLTSHAPSRPLLVQEPSSVVQGESALTSSSLFALCASLLALTILLHCR